MKRYPVIPPTFADGTPSVLAILHQSMFVPQAPFPYGMGDVTARYCWYSEEQVKARPELLQLCGEPIEVSDVT